MKKALLFKFIALGLFAFFSFGVVNAQVPNAWINEIHYDNLDADIDEAVEVVIENSSSFDLSLLAVTLYNGSGGAFYDNDAVSTFVPGTTYGNFTFYSLVYASNGIQNGAPDGIALSYNGTLIQFLSYEGTFLATDGPAIGVTSTDIGVSEGNTDPIGQSLQLSGTGMSYDSFVWEAPATATYGTINNGQLFGAEAPDVTGPVAITDPADGATDVAINTSVILTFDEAIRNLDDSEITNANVADLLTFKETDASGVDVPFTATIDATKMIITATPDADLKNSQLYYGGLASVEDVLDNASPAGSMTFTTIAVDSDPPTFTSVPTDGDVDVAVNTTVTFTFNEAIRNIDDAEITDLNVAALLTLKDTDASGADIAFTATIDIDKKVITLTPDADLANNQVYYAAIAAVEDGLDNASTGGSLNFTSVAVQVTAIAQVFITEIADPNNYLTDHSLTIRYIELYNAGDVAIDFTENTGWRIDKYTNASSTVSQTLYLTGTIQPKEFYIIATNVDNGSFLTTYGVSADQFDGAADNVAGSNGDDNLELYNGSDELVDQFGVPGEDGTGTDHEFEDGRAERVATVTQSNPIWDVAEWNIDSDAPSGDGPQEAPADFDPRAWIGESTTAIAELSSPKLNIYPNPNNGKFFVQMGSAFKANTKVEVFNVVGMKVLETITNDFKTEIDISSMKQGVYYVRVDDGANILTQKVIKQ